MADIDILVVRSGRDVDEAPLFAEALRFRLAILARFSKEACGLTFRSSIRHVVTDWIELPTITCCAWRAKECPCNCACVSIKFFGPPTVTLTSVYACKPHFTPAL